MKTLTKEKNWKTLTQFLPQGWEKKASETGAIQRHRNIKTNEDLLRVLFIYLADGLSLKDAAASATAGEIADISAVGINKRLKQSGEWLLWIVQTMLKETKGQEIKKPKDFEWLNVRNIDATVVNEPGSNGTDWRLHYSQELFSLRCDEFIITDPKTGESCTNFHVNENDLLVGDKGYCNHKGMMYISENKGYFLFSYKDNSFTIYNQTGEKITLIKELEKIKECEVLDLKVKAGLSDGKDNEKISVRIVGIKKSPVQAEASVKRARKARKKKQKQIHEETLEYQKYVIMVTNLPENIQADRILELYRLRWQIELNFKRLKSIFGLGHLPNQNPDSAKAWLHGKLLVALLVQMIYDRCCLFSPWGYPTPGSG